MCVCVCVCSNVLLNDCSITMVTIYLQLFEESTKLQNLRLEKQQDLQKRHLRELKEFADTFSSSEKIDHTHPSCDRSSTNSEQSHSSSTNVSMGTSSL